MKKFLSSWVGSLNYDKMLSGVVLLLVGFLIITNGSIGIKATPESDIRWIEAFSKIDAWVGWVVVWVAFDNLVFTGKVTAFILSKTLQPFVRAVLVGIVGEEKLNAFVRRFEKKEGKEGGDETL